MGTRRLARSFSDLRHGNGAPRGRSERSGYAAAAPWDNEGIAPLPDSSTGNPMHAPSGRATMNEDNNDMLRHIFELQTELNNYVFEKNQLRDERGELLAMDTITAAVGAGRLRVNDLPNRWLANYAKAMEEELKELNDELLWKWWSKDQINLQNIRVELIDILHFLISALISAGLTPEKVYDIYRQKHAVNLKRQDSGYSRETKSEADNHDIG